jgi:UDP-N-acetylglucosamine acyltransferase
VSAILELPHDLYIDPRAVVDASAELALGVRVEAFAYVGAGVRLGAYTHLHPHAVVVGGATLGTNNIVHSFAVLGGPPQRHRGGATTTLPVEIGDFNEFREHTTVHCGTVNPTRVGSHCLLMAGAHVGHDVVVGDHVTLANGVQLAGHVRVDSYATFGGLSAVAQHLHVGESAFVAGGAMCERNVPPFVIVQGDRARVRSLNRVGLVRRGFTAGELEELRNVFRHFRARDKEPLVNLSRRAQLLAAALGLPS